MHRVLINPCSCHSVFFRWAPPSLIPSLHRSTCCFSPANSPVGVAPADMWSAAFVPMTHAVVGIRSDQWSGLASAMRFTVVWSRIKLRINKSPFQTWNYQVMWWSFHRNGHIITSDRCTNSGNYWGERYLTDFMKEDPLHHFLKWIHLSERNMLIWEPGKINIQCVLVWAFSLWLKITVFSCFVFLGCFPSDKEMISYLRLWQN